MTMDTAVKVIFSEIRGTLGACVCLLEMSVSCEFLVIMRSGAQRVKVKDIVRRCF